MKLHPTFRNTHQFRFRLYEKELAQQNLSNNFDELLNEIIFPVDTYI